MASERLLALFGPGSDSPWTDMLDMRRQFESKSQLLEEAFASLEQKIWVKLASIEEKVREGQSVADAQSKMQVAVSTKEATTEPVQMLDATIQTYSDSITTPMATQTVAFNQAGQSSGVDDRWLYEDSPQPSVKVYCL